MATDFTSQITAWYQAVQFRNPPASDLAVYNASLQSGTLTTAQVQTAILNDPFTSNFVNPVIREYQAAFGRVPDQAGLAFWVAQVAASPNALAQLNVIFANSAEFQTRFGANATTPASPAVVTALYTNVLGRSPDAAGLAFWQGQNLTASQLLQAFAQSGEFISQTNGAVTAFETLEVTGGAIPTTGSLFSVAGTSVPGSTFVLTTGTDALVGTNGNDIFNGDQSGATAAQFQVSIADSINGGAGTDTFNEFVGGNAFVLPQLTSVEVVNVVGSTVAQVINTTTVSGITNFNYKNDATGGHTTTVGAGVTVGFDNVTAGTEAVNYATGATTGALNFLNGSTTGVVTVGNATGTTLTSLSVNSTGSAANKVAGIAQAAGEAITTVTVTGDKALTITAALPTTVLTVDGTNDVGGMTVALGTVAAGKTVTVNGGVGADTVDLTAVTNADTVVVNLGAGNDVLKVGANLATWVGGTSLDGGPGTDIMNITTGASLTTATAAYIKNFETLDVSGGGAGTYNSTLGGFTNYQADANVGGAGSGAVVFSNVASTGFVFSEIGAKGVNTTDTSLQLNLKTQASTTDAVTVNLVATDGNNDATANGQTTLTTLTLDGTGATGAFETVTINSTVVNPDTGVSASKYVNTITTLTDATSGAGDSGLTTLVLTGNAGLTITTALGATTVANLTKVDASADTGPDTMSLVNAAKSVTFLGSAGVDTVTFGNNGASIYGGAGNDQFNLSAVHTTADTLVFKAGTDTAQTLDATAKFISATSTLETVTNFQSVADAQPSHDTIDLTNLGFAGVAKAVAQLGTIATVNGGTFASTSATLFTDAGGARGVAVGNDGANTYVFIDANKDGVFNAATDIVVKLAGVHTVSAADFAF